MKTQPSPRQMDRVFVGALLVFFDEVDYVASFVGCVVFPLPAIVVDTKRFVAVSVLMLAWEGRPTEPGNFSCIPESTGSIGNSNAAFYFRDGRSETHASTPTWCEVGVDVIACAISLNPLRS